MRGFHYRWRFRTRSLRVRHARATKSQATNRRDNGWSATLHSSILMPFCVRQGGYFWESPLSRSLYSALVPRDARCRSDEHSFEGKVGGRCCSACAERGAFTRSSACHSTCAIIGLAGETRIATVASPCDSPATRSSASESGRTHSICQVLANSCRSETKQNQRVTTRVSPAE